VDIPCLFPSYLKMTEVLAWEDYLTIGLYFALVLAVGLWVSITARNTWCAYSFKTK